MGEKNSFSIDLMSRPMSARFVEDTEHASELKWIPVIVESLDGIEIGLTESDPNTLRHPMPCVLSTARDEFDRYLRCSGENHPGTELSVSHN